MTSQGVERQATRPFANIAMGALIVTLTAAGCTRPVSGSTDIAPTYIPQPTPDPTMREIIAGRGSPVVYLPPLEIRGSPTPAPGGSRSGGSTTRPATKPSQPSQPAAPAREPAPAPAPAREPAAAPKPAAPTAAPKPAPAPAPAPAAKPAPPANSGSGGSSAPPSLFNPSNVLPGGPSRPNPTPGR